MSVTVKDVLELPAYKDCRLIAGSRGIYNIVLYADGMEVPDIKPWLRPHLLMITTGYSIRNFPNAVTQLILDLHHAGSAALAIKTKFVGETDKCGCHPNCGGAGVSCYRSARRGSGV